MHYCELKIELRLFYGQLLHDLADQSQEVTRVLKSGDDWDHAHQRLVELRRRVRAVYAALLKHQGQHGC